MEHFLGPPGLQGWDLLVMPCLTSLSQSREVTIPRGRYFLHPAEVTTDPICGTEVPQIRVAPPLGEAQQGGIYQGR